MDQDLRIFAAKMRRDLPTLDLHEFIPSQVLDKLEFFLYTIFQQKEPAARIVYGIGVGQLKKIVLECLKKHPLVAKIEEEAGSCIIILNKKVI